MGKNFKNINEELQRIKTLMYETDEMVQNGTKGFSLNESVSENMDEKLLGKSGTKVIQKGKLGSFLRGGGNSPVYKIIFTDNADKYLEIDPKDNTSFVLNAAGFKEAKDNGLPVNTGDMVRLVGKKEKQDKDKILVTIIKPTEMGVVTGTELAKVDPAKVEQLAVSSGSAGTSGSAGSAGSTGTSGTNGTSSANVSTDSLVGKKLKDSGLNLNDIIDVTDKFNTYGYSGRAYYKINKTTKDVYGVGKDDTIEAVWVRGKAPQKESFNMDLLFVNPLLFESVLNEADEIDMSLYTCMGNCKGQKTMDADFTKLVDDSLAGKEIKKRTKKSDGSGGGDDNKSKGWGSYTCVSKNPAMKESKMTNGSTVYVDGGNVYYSNGRFKDKKTGTMGNYHCEGDKIVSDKGGSTGGSKAATVVSDADLMGETGILYNLIKSAPVIAAVTSLVTPLSIPLKLLSLGASQAFSAVTKRKGVKGVVDALDYIVTQDDLVYVLATVKGLQNKFYYDEEVESYVPAMKRFLELYSEDEGGDNLIADIESVGTRTLPTGSEKLKRIIIKNINSQLSVQPPSDLPKVGSDQNI